MPIHFRCAFCNQLLGIARRKSGSVINCPTCGGPLVVPHMPGGEDKSEEEKSGVDKPAANRLLEECDFDVILKPPEPAHAVGASVLGTTPGSAVPMPVSPSAKSAGASALAPRGNGAGGMASARSAQQPAGIVVSTTRATILAVVIVLLLAAAFAAGFVAGRVAS